MIISFKHLLKKYRKIRKHVKAPLYIDIWMNVYKSITKYFTFTVVWAESVVNFLLRVSNNFEKANINIIIFCQGWE